MMEFLETTDTVVVMSSGNSGYWAENTNDGYLYSDGVSFQTGGTPGTYTNALAVASVDNDGKVGPFIRVQDTVMVYTESKGSFKKVMTAMDKSDDGSGTEYPYVYIDGFGYPGDYAGIDLEGKVVFCSRGALPFYEIANNAAKLGAAAIVIYNNESGPFAMNVSGYMHTAPCVSILRSEAAAVKAASSKQTTEAGVEYYTGTVTISRNTGGSEYDSDYYSMSAFSSWGVPGSLEMKPEITAPGGNIWSVNGVDPSGAAYEVLSGTSMAAPQVSGMAALVAQYIKDRKLDEQTGLSVRQLAQSLLMSTAVPVKEYSSGGEYYSILNQGAGLARVDQAVSAESYVTVAAQPDGKVKAELGDDADREGVYEFSFSIHNLDGKDLSYELSADLFTQQVFDGGDGTMYLHTSTKRLGAEVAFAAQGNTVRVPANGSVSVDVHLQLTEDTVAYLEANYPTGAYIEGYVFATPVTDEEGVVGVTHSIPVLGYYGSWSESSMYDVGGYLKYETGSENRKSYLYDVNGIRSNYMSISYGDGKEYLFGGNPLIEEDAYLPERNAFNNQNGSMLQYLRVTQIRNAAASMILVDDAATGEEYHALDLGPINTAYYSTTTGSWQQSQHKIPVFLNLKGIGEGTRLNVSLVSAPEYYCTYDKEGKATVRWDALEEGAYLTTSFTIDNTAPEISEVKLAQNNTLKITARDNQYIAAVALMDISGEEMLTAAAANQTSCGVVTTCELDLNNVFGEEFLVVVYDYAKNKSVYEVNLTLENERPRFTAIDRSNLDPDGCGSYVGLSADGSVVKLADTAQRCLPRAVEYVEGAVFEVTDDGKLYVGYDDALSGLQFLRDLNPTGQWMPDSFADLAYNKADGKLYGLFNSGSKTNLCTIDLSDGDMTVVGQMPIDVDSMAIDGQGNFYSVTGDSGMLYTYKSDVTKTGQYTSVGKLDADKNTEDNYMAWDHNTDELFYILSKNDVSTLVKIDPGTAGTALVGTFDFATGGLYIAYEPETDRFAPVNKVSALRLEETAAMLAGHSVQLHAQVLPWNVSDGSVIWSSGNEAVATVDENGLVKGVSAGTAVITAASSLDPTTSAACTVTVSALDKTMKAVIWDEEGKIWWSEFNTDAAGDYQKITSTNLPISATMVADGRLYASTLDTDSYLSDLYLVDPETFDMKKVGGSDSIAYFDMAYAPSLGYGMGVYFDYVVLIDLETGECVGTWEWGKSLEADLVGITYCGSTYNEIYDTYQDTFLLLDADGNIYEDSWIIADTQRGYINGPEKGFQTNIGGSVNYRYFQGFCYDGDYVYWTRFNEADNAVELRVWDRNATGNVYSVGWFPEGVWPVGGLYSDDEIFSYNPFTDVPEGSFYHDPVLWAVRKDITNGTTSTTFDPSGECMRGHVVTFLWRAMGSPEPTITDNPFVDVPANEYYYKAVLWAYEKGITTGVDDDHFDPTGKCNRAQVVTFLWRAMGKPAPTTGGTFSDVVPTEFYAEAVAWAVEKGITNGMDDGTFGVMTTCNRAHAVTFLYRTLA